MLIPEALRGLPLCAEVLEMLDMLDMLDRDAGAGESRAQGCARTWAASAQHAGSGDLGPQENYRG